MRPAGGDTTHPPAAASYLKTHSTTGNALQNKGQWQPFKENQQMASENIVVFIEKRLIFIHSKGHFGAEKVQYTK